MPFLRARWGLWEGGGLFFISIGRGRETFFRVNIRIINKKFFPFLPTIFRPYRNLVYAGLKDEKKRKKLYPGSVFENYSSLFRN